MRTYTADPYNIDLGTITTATGLSLVTASFNSLALTAPVTPIITGAIASYMFKINSMNGLYSNNAGLLQVFFPQEITLSLQSTSSCIAIATTYNLNCVVNLS